MPFVVACVVFGLMYMVMYHTPFGHYIIAIGGNEEGSTLSGVNTVFWKLMVYAVGGTLAGIAGVLMAARLTAADSVVGVGWEFDAVAVTVLGGTSFEMGRGGIRGTVLGVALIAMLRNGLNVIGVNPAYQALVLGLVIMGSIVVDVALEKRKEG
jgi:ribose transport system permease protein